MYRKTYVQINLDTIQKNVKNIIEAYPSYQHYIGVVKGNVYGHGSYTVKAMIEAGINYLAVASLEEALNIRKIEKEIPILCLQPIELDAIEKAIQNNITLTISSLKYLEALEKKIKKAPIKMHIKVNTGMNRLGFKEKEELKKAVSIICENYILEGIYTHFITLGISDPYWDRQIQKWQELTSEIDISVIPIVHAAKSLTLINHPKIPFCNGVRIGILMYGLNQSPKEDLSWKGKLRKIKAKRRIKKYRISPTTLICKAKVEPAFSLFSNIIEIQTVKKGEFVGYGIGYQAKEEERIGIVPIGYADGFCRNNQNRLVYINGKKYPIVGSVNMGMIQIKIDESAKIGDIVEIIGKHIPISYVSAHLKTTPYESMCMIHKSIPRIYIKDGKKIYEE